MHAADTFLWNLESTRLRRDGTVTHNLHISNAERTGLRKRVLGTNVVIDIGLIFPVRLGIGRSRRGSLLSLHEYRF